MRLSVGLVFVAVSGVTVSAASQPAAEVYILQAKSKAVTQAPQLPKEVARHILLQRALTSSYGSSLSDIPSSIDQETAISYISQYGKSPASLFGQPSSQQTSQLVMILEGVTENDAKPLKEALAKADQQPAFAISDPPSASANDKLMSYFRAAGVAMTRSCDIASAINPFESACWEGSSSVVKYDVQKDFELVHNLLDNMPRLANFVSTGALEVTLLLMPEYSRRSKASAWSTAEPSIADLRRRDEHVMTDATSSSAISNPTSLLSSPNPGFAATFDRKLKVPACFTSFDKCTSGTNNCTGHGTCIDKLKGETKEPCFVCMCQATVDRTGDEKGAIGRKVTHWGGRACQKVDVSTSFWLLAGTAIVLAGSVAFAISLLFNVGEEELPGVIGAGVSRSK